MNSASAIQTFTGIFFDPFAPDPALIRIEDIAHSLSLQCRFTGHVRRHWSIAQHSLLVADLCPPEHKLWGLLHDATEAYLVDLPRPIKKHPAMAEYRRIESDLERVIAERFGLSLPIPDEVHVADNITLFAEADALLHGTTPWRDVRPEFTGNEEFDSYQSVVDAIKQRIEDIKYDDSGGTDWVRDHFLWRFQDLTNYQSKVDWKLVECS
jgi:5'-deoxynucleotidase YfbR-like HD superfamily hydrolase